MTPRSDALLRWSPRILGILVALFLGLFALDAFGAGKPFPLAIADFLLHLTPTFSVLALVALAWRSPWIGAVGFAGLAVGYAVAARQHPAWIAAISGPLLLAGALFFWSWANRRRPGSVA